MFYQLIIHACSEAIFMKYILSTNFSPVSNFQCEASGWIYPCVWMHAAQTSEWLSDTSGHAWSCRLLIFSLHIVYENPFLFMGWVDIDIFVLFGLLYLLL
jgi:hypothetical protein